ncbi:unnamed protein product [Thelazia callipaeda]|uniref:Uncharacterized protein n=1 Tax=Thelazia callipaeda TaxID=103827 RepID=A0A0N5CVI5_THECL|nr:unnamed protein product [Thelazia callipaeda]
MLIRWRSLCVVLSIVQLGLADSSLSYHPDYSRPSLANTIIIAGALLSLIILLLVLLLLLITRPKVMIDRGEPLSHISLRKRCSAELIPCKESEGEKVVELHSLEMSNKSTESKSGSECEPAQTSPSNDEIPKLPTHMMNIEGGEPVVLFFKKDEPQHVILPVYIVVKNDAVPKSKTSITLDEALVTPPTSSTQFSVSNPASFKSLTTWGSVKVAKENAKTSTTRRKCTERIKPSTPSSTSSTDKGD